MRMLEYKKKEPNTFTENCLALHKSNMGHVTMDATIFSYNLPRSLPLKTFMKGSPDNLLFSK